MQHLRGRFRGRLEHESPPRHARMRQHKRRRLKHDRIVEQQIEVDRPRPPSPVRRRPRRFSICCSRAKRASGASDVSILTAPLRKRPCAGGPPTDAVSCQTLVPRTATCGCRRSSATASSSAERRSPSFDPRAIKQTGMAGTNSTSVQPVTARDNRARIYTTRDDGVPRVLVEKLR